MTGTDKPTITKREGVTLVALGPEYENLDDSRLDDLKNALLEIADSASPPMVVLDLSQTQFFGSDFIEVVFRVWNRLNQRQGGQFALCGLTEYCADVIEVTNLNRLWDVFDTCDEAVRSLKDRTRTT